MSHNVADLAVWPPRPLSRAQLDAIWARRDEWGHQPTRNCPVSVSMQSRLVDLALFGQFNVICTPEAQARHRWGQWESRKTADGSVDERQCVLCGQIARRWNEQKSEHPVTEGGAT